MHGDQHGRQIDLAGYEGGDWYEIASRGADLYVSDSAGNDFFNFTHASSGVNLNMALNNGQKQVAAGGNALRFWGDIEHAKGSHFADVILGTVGGNLIDGNGGADVIHGGLGNDLLYGGAGDDFIHAGPGHDTVYGGDGHDIILGGDGNDSIWGGNGLDFIIGGRGTDGVYGDSGDDLLIGGTTAFDANAGALHAILAEWTSNKLRKVRQLNIQNGALWRGPGGTVYDDYEFDFISRGYDDALVFNDPGDALV